MDPKANTIFIVDDDASTCEALSELLKLCGYSVACAENGLVALNKLQTWPAPPALILLDLLMPVMDGHTFVHRAREDHRLKDVPVVVTTADPCAHPSGVDAILRKPVKFEILMSTVRQFMKRAEDWNL